ncbi:MAG: 2-oxoacid:acceptor oxidoreductase family protein [Nitrospiraceae bacterium]|nr:2-oxoacid:acceptor oxidoreductase family protein [Nitrospiraceae bacterium]MDA8324720.1 2-oxoacid:acceptor oxidoreductase family protein [Nitrospiraceae bacterium]
MPSLLIAGSGGQGILFAGKLVAQAAIEEGMNVTWFPSYGAEVRGGTANCTVVISEGRIGSPIVSSPDILVVMNRASLERFGGKVKKDGIIILNSSMVDAETANKDLGVKVAGVPAGEIAYGMGAPLAANMVICGALARAASICGFASMERALKKLAPRGKPEVLAVNQEALKRGWRHIGN